MIIITPTNLKSSIIGITGNRQRLSTIAFTLGIIFSFSHHSVYSIFLPLSWFFLGLGAILAPSWTIGPKWVFAGLVLILASMGLAIPGNILFGDGDWPENVAIFIIAVPFLAIYLADHKGDILLWIMPAMVIHSALIIAQGLTGAYPPAGLAINRNPAAGVLVLAALWLVSSRFRWLTILLVIAIGFTGSRWATVTLAALLIAMGTFKVLPWRWAIPMLILETAVFVMTTAFLADRYAEAAQVIQAANTDIWHRLGISHPLSLIPHGSIRTDDMHNVPVRMAAEFGILAAFAWTAITAYGLIRRPLFDITWWLLLALATLSMMDYYTFYGPVAAWWWLLVGLRTKIQTNS